MIEYNTIDAALAGMRLHLDQANRLILENGALPPARIRRMIDEHLDQYHLAAREFARLTHHSAREREHSYRPAPLSSVPDPSGRKPPLGRPVE